MKKIILVTMILFIFSTTQYNITHTMDKPNKQAFIIQKNNSQKVIDHSHVHFAIKRSTSILIVTPTKTHVGIIKH